MIKNKDKLLQDIADGLKDQGRHQLANLEVVFYVEEASYSFPVAVAIDNIVNDIYWDERGNWSDADRAEVQTL